MVKDFLKAALADKPAVPFRVPPGIKLVRVDSKPACAPAPAPISAILEAFKPGTAPPDNYSVVGGTASDSTADGRGGQPRCRPRGALRAPAGSIETLTPAVSLFEPFRRSV